MLKIKFVTKTKSSEHRGPPMFFASVPRVGETVRLGKMRGFDSEWRVEKIISVPTGCPGGDGASAEIVVSKIEQPRGARR